MQKSETI